MCALCFSKIRSIRIKKLRLNNVVDTHNPHTSVPQYSYESMSTTRGLIPFGAYLCAQYSKGSSRDRHRVACFSALIAIWDLIYRGPTQFDDHQVSLVRASVDAFSDHYRYLNHLGLQRQCLAYHVTRKCHYVWHMADESKYINPRVGGCCLADEDYVGKISVLARGCMKCCSNKKLMRAIMVQYVQALAIRWSVTLQ